MELFNYTHTNESFDTLVDKVIAMSRAHLDSKNAGEMVEATKELNYEVCKEIVKDTKYEKNFEAEGLSLFKNPQVTKNGTIRENFEAVVVQVLTAVVPEVASARYLNYLAEIRQIGWGDTAVFKIDNNELFAVNQVAEGIQRGVLQPIYNDEVTVNCGPITISTSIDWYQVAAGVFDWGKAVVKMSKSFESYIFLKIIAAMSSAMTGYGTAYSAAGFNKTNWTRMTQLISAANGHSDVYAIGTLTALGNVLPDAAGLQYGLGERMASEGYLDRYIGAKLIPLDQALVPGTFNSSAVFAVPDNKIYFVAADSNRPVKLVFEGNSVTVENDASQSNDKTFALTIGMRIGVTAVVGSKIGCITLA